MSLTKFIRESGSLQSEINQAATQPCVYVNNRTRVLPDTARDIACIHTRFTLHIFRCIILAVSDICSIVLHSIPALTWIYCSYRSQTQHRVAIELHTEKYRRRVTSSNVINEKFAIITSRLRFTVSAQFRSFSSNVELSPQIIKVVRVIWNQFL